MMRTACRASSAGAGAGARSTAGGDCRWREDAWLDAPELIGRELEGTSDGGDKRFQFRDQFGIEIEVDLLLAVAPGFRRVGVDLDEEAVGIERDRRLAQFEDHVGATAALAGVDDDGEMRFLLDDGHGAE